MQTRELLSPCVRALSLAVLFHDVTLNHIHEGTCSSHSPGCYLYKAEAELYLATALTCLGYYFQGGKVFPCSTTSIKRKEKP